MSNLTLAVGYLIVVLHEFWAGNGLIEVGRVLEVERPLRNDLVGSGVARDATDEEIAAHRDGHAPSEEGGDDDRPTAADLAAAQAQLQALEAERDALQSTVTDLKGEVESLTVGRETLIRERDALLPLVGERDALRAELDALKAKSSKGAKPPAGE